MTTFSGYYTQSTYGRFWFEADSAEEAHDLINKVDRGEIEWDSLLKFDKRERGYELFLNPIVEESE